MQNNLQIILQNSQDVQVYLKQGDYKFNNKYYKESIKLYDLVIKIDPLCSSAYINKGKVYSIQRKYNKAFNMFDKAQELNPLNYEVCFNRGITYFSQNDYQKAIQQFDNAIKLNSQDPVVYLKKGDSLISLGNMEEALQMYKTAIKYNLNSQEFIKKGDQYLKDKKYDLALRFYELLAELNPLVSYFKRGDTLIEQGKIEEAFCIFKEALKYNPELDQFQKRGDQYLAKLQLDLGFRFYELLVQQDPLESCLVKGMLNIIQGKIEDAFFNFRQAINYNLDYNQFLNEGYEFGDVFCSIKQYDLAINCYKLLAKFDHLKGYLKLGDTLLEQGGIEEAFFVFSKALKHNPKSDEFLKRGDKYFNEKKYELALQFYQMVEILDPLKCVLQIGDTLIEQGKIEEAFCIFKESLKNNKKLEEFQKRGDNYFNEEKYDIAIQFYRLEATLDPLKCILQIGDTLIEQGKIEEAFCIFEDSLKNNSKLDEFQKRGDKYFNQKQYDIAIFFYQLVATLDPLKCVLQIGDTLIEQGKIEEAFCIFEDSLKNNSKLDEFQKRGDKYFNQKQYDLAIFFYQLVATLDPLKCVLQIGDTLILQGKTERAFNIFNESLKNNPKLDELQLRGDKYFNYGKYDIAIQFYRLVATLDPLKCVLQIGDTLMLQGKIEEAFCIFNESLNNNPKLYQFQKRGDKYFNEKKYDIAIQFYQMVATLNPLKSLLQIGDTLIEQGKIEEAFCRFKEFLKYNPKFEEFQKRGDQYLQEKQYDLAIKFYELLVEQDPLESCLNIGDILIKQGKIEEAFYMFREALKYNPHSDQFLIRGYQFYELKQYDVALKFYELLAKLDPLECCLNIGDTLIIQGKIEEAFYMFREALKYNPHSDQFLIRGNQYFQIKLYDVASKFYQLLAILNPMQHYFKQGDTLIEQGKIEEAFCKFKEVLKYNPKLDEFQKRGYIIYITGDKYFNEKKYDIAIQFYQLVATLDPLKCTLQIGDSLMELGKNEEAFCLFKDALKNNPDKYYFLNQGNQYFIKKQYDIAIIFYKQLGTLQPLWGYMRQGDTLLAQGKIEEAFYMYREALKYNPDKDEINYQGDQYLKKKQYNIAIKFYQLLQKLHPLQCYLKQGDILIIEGKIEEAFCMFRKAVKYNLRSDEFIFRGDCYLKNKQYDHAKKIYKLLAKFDPLKSYLQQGYTLIEQGKIEEAFSMFKEAFKNNPDMQEFFSRGKQYCLEQLQGLAIYFLELDQKLDQLRKLMELDEQLIMQGKIRINEDLHQSPKYLKKNIKSRDLQKYKSYALIVNAFLLDYYQSDNIEHYLIQGDLFYALGRTREAIQILKMIPPEANLRYMLYLTRQFQQADQIFKYSKDSNLKSAWAYHNVLILQEQGIYDIDLQQEDQINCVGANLHLYK